MESEPVLLFLSLPSIELFKILLLLGLLVSSALISGAEVAFFSLTPVQLEEEKEKQLKKIELIEQLLSKPKRLLATILVANNFINIGIVLLFANLGGAYLSGIENPLIRLMIEVVLITFIILLFGEILPKIYANRKNVTFAKIMAAPLYNIERYFLFFLTLPMSRLTLFLENRFGQRNASFSVDQLSQALEFTDQHDTTLQDEQILQGIITFGNTEAKQVMCPRVDVFALEKEDRMEEILPKIIANGFSRIPVYSGQLDEVEGVLYVKDLMPKINQKNYDWTKLLRPAYFVPENKKLDDLLKEFQTKKIHIAVVVDEYGGTSGVITLEDLIEEIVGDISDEFDDEDIEYSKIDNSTYVFEAKISLKDFYRITKTPFEEQFEKEKGEAETVGGFILETAKSLPKIGQKIIFNKVVFTIESVDKKRIKQVKVSFPK